MLPIDPEDRLLQALRGLRPEGEGSAPADTGFDPGHLERIARAARSLRDDPAAETVAPPEGLWGAISAELGFGAIDDAGAHHDEAPLTEPTLAPQHGAPIDEAGPAQGGADPVAPVLALTRPAGTARRRSWRPGRPLVVAMAAALVAIAGVSAALVSNRGSSPSVVAEVALDALEDGGSGQATLVRLNDGRVRLEISQQLAEVPADSYVEVWLIDPSSDLERMVSLGSVERSATFNIPNGIDPATYSIVDVSIEPADGNPTHSGRSVLRGTLAI